MKNRNIQFKPTAGVLIGLLLGCFGLSPMVQAQGPDTEGAIAGSNNGEGIGVLVGRTTGVFNTGTGYQALHRLTVGNQNTAMGFRALLSDTNGNFNTATGAGALLSNTTGDGNTANGWAALYGNTTGGGNTAYGSQALFSNTTQFENCAFGDRALFSNTTGQENNAFGGGALMGNTAGRDNNAFGLEALEANTAGNFNNAFGRAALHDTTNGSNNNAFGDLALRDNRTGSNNTAIGHFAGLNITGSGNVCIGQGISGPAGENNTTRIRNVYPSLVSGRAVYVNSGNKLGTLMSSRRFKDEIKRMDKASEAILALKPVTFRYKKEIEPNGDIMFGLIAEEVEKVAPELVTRDAKGEVETVRYEAVNAMLLNEFLKEHSRVEEQGRKIQEQEATITALKSTAVHQQKAMEAVTVRLDQQAAQIQKVSAQLEVSRAVPQTVLNNQ
jgi:hypothetical protein